MRFQGFLIIGCLAFFSCKKTPVAPPEAMPLPDAPANTGINFQIKIHNVVNGTPLVLGSTTYTNANTDTFSVSLFKYYFTNVSLFATGGQTVKVPESYFLIDQSDSTSFLLTLKNIPEGNYDHLTFMIGVDAARNTSGAQTGALDPLNGMFWGWNTGYIMAKMEGHSPQSGNSSKLVTFHMGGFTGRSSGVRSVELNLPIDIQIRAGREPQINLSADLAKWFSGGTTVSFASVYDVTTVSSMSGNIADNYANMFTVTSVTN